MTPTLRRKLEALAERREELERLLSDPGVVADNERFRKFSREFPFAFFSLAFPLLSPCFPRLTPCAVSVRFCSGSGPELFCETIAVLRLYVENP
mgnify:CR=1 FL=1